MAITVDTANISNATPAGNADSPQSWSHLCGSSVRLLVVAITIYDTSDTDGVVSGINYNGTALTKGTQYYDSVSDGHVSVWYLKTPTTGSSLTIEVSFGGTVTDFMGSAMGVEGSGFEVDATATPNTTTTSPTISFDTATADTILVDAMLSDQSVGSKLSADSPQSAMHLNDVGSDTVGASYKVVTSSGPQTMSWTDTDDDEDCVSVAIAFKEVTVPVPTNIEKSLDYKIIDTPSAITKSLEYSVEVIIADNLVKWGDASLPAAYTNKPWTGLKDGEGNVPIIVGGDYGNLKLDIDKIGQTEVVDTELTTERQLTVSKNDIYGQFWVFVRGSATVFFQENKTLEWEYYDGPIKKSWRYMQIKLVGKQPTAQGVIAEMDFIVACSYSDQNLKYPDWSSWWTGADIQGCVNSNRVSYVTDEWVEPGTGAMAMVNLMRGIEYLKDNNYDTTKYESIVDAYFDTWLRTNNQAQYTTGDDSGGYTVQVYYDDVGNYESMGEASGAVTGQVMTVMWAYYKYLGNIGETTKATNWIDNNWTIFKNAADYLINLFDNYNGTDIDMIPANTTNKDCWIHAAVHGRVALLAAVDWATLKSASTSDYSRVAAALVTGIAAFKNTGTQKTYYKVRKWNVSSYDAGEYDGNYDQLCHAPIEFGAMTPDTHSEDVSDWFTAGDGTYRMTWLTNDPTDWRHYGTRWHWYITPQDENDYLYPGPGFQLGIAEMKIYLENGDRTYLTRAVKRLIWGTSIMYSNIWWFRTGEQDVEVPNGFQDWRDGGDYATVAETWARFCDTSGYYIEILMLLENKNYNY